MIHFIIYLIGFLICYRYIKKSIRHDNNDWSDVFATFLFSLGSFYMCIILYVFNYFEDKEIKFNETMKELFKRDPPKWM
jgi:hypothetical protein